MELQSQIEANKKNMLDAQARYDSQLSLKDKEMKENSERAVWDKS